MKKIREDFINQYPPLNLMTAEGAKELRTPQKVHMYIHIPYCVKKCSFCYYKSFEVALEKVPEEYITALIDEMALYANENYILRSLYIGGGTPTMMTEQQIARLLEAVSKYFKTTHDFEFCCEVRPGPETTKEKIRLLKEYGLKRVSIGCQSLNNSVLRRNGRTHSAEAFYRCFELVRNENIFSANVDLMSGMIDDTEESFLQSVEKLVKLSPENITIYKMQLYYNSKLYMQLRKDPSVKIMSDQEELLLVKKAYEMILNRGYELADNFSFRKSNEYEHIHRTGGWQGETMLGLGLSSHSLNGQYIYQNCNSLNEYYEEIKAGKRPISRAYKMSLYELMVREFIFGIKRLTYDINDFYIKFGIPLKQVFAKEIDKLVSQGVIRFEGDILKVDFENALIADDIVRELFPFGQAEIFMGYKRREH